MRHSIYSNILESINQIIIISFDGGIVPSSMKKAIIIAILKKPTLNKNVLTITVLFRHYYVSLKCQNKLFQNFSPNSSQTTINSIHYKVFKKEYQSPETSLTVVTKDILMSTNNNLITIPAMIELFSAFDTLNYELIIHTK